MCEKHCITEMNSLMFNLICVLQTWNVRALYRNGLDVCGGQHVKFVNFGVNSKLSCMQDQKWTLNAILWLIQCQQDLHKNQFCLNTVQKKLPANR